MIKDNTFDPAIPVVQPEIHDDGSHDERISAAANAHVNVNRIELSERTLSIVAIVASTAAVLFSIFAYIQYSLAEREFRLLQNQQQMTNGWLARMGAISPMDVYQGPEGNFFFKPPPPKGK